MNKIQKLEYIKSVHARIGNAPNHGHQGTNWWYPTPYTVAYDVKIHTCAKDIEDVRARMSPVQNKYYTDDDLYTMYYNTLEDACEMLRDELKEIPRVQCVRFAGRSGGWCEVSYTPLEDTTYQHELSAQDVNALYKEAQALEKSENDVRTFIEKSHKSLCSYLDSEEYVTDIINSLGTDAEIIHTKQAIADAYRALS